MIDNEGQSGPKEPKLEVPSDESTGAHDPTLQLEHPHDHQDSDGDTNSVIERMAAQETHETLGEAPTTATRAVDVSLGGDGATHFISSSAASRDSTNRRRMEFLNMAEWVSQKVQNRGYAFYGKLATIVLSTYFLSDVAATVAGRYIPEPPAARMQFNSNSNRIKNIAEYNTIFTRNLFNHEGLIPGDDTANGSNIGGAPVKTTLPFDLIGTLILEDSAYSLATIEDKSASTIYPVRVDEEIPKKAKITKIEARKVVFVNLAAGRLEYVELPDDPTGATPSVTLAAGKGPSIEKVGANQFSIPKSELDKTLADFNNVLTQARAVPYFENGVPAGYRFFQITPGSVYDKLGLKNGDVVAGINGQPLTDPSKAFEFLNSLKEGASHMELQLKTSDGKTQTNSYDFH